MGVSVDVLQTRSSLAEVENLYFNYQSRQARARRAEEDEKRRSESQSKRARIAQAIDGVLAPDQAAAAAAARAAARSVSAAPTPMDVDAATGSDADADGEEDDELHTPVADSTSPVPAPTKSTPRPVTPTTATRTPAKLGLTTPSTPHFRQSGPAASPGSAFMLAAQAAGFKSGGMPMPMFPQPFGSPLRQPPGKSNGGKPHGPMVMGPAPYFARGTDGRLFSVVFGPSPIPSIFPVPEAEAERMKKMYPDQLKSLPALPVFPAPPPLGPTPGAGPSRVPLPPPAANSPRASTIPPPRPVAGKSIAPGSPSPYPGGPTWPPAAPVPAVTASPSPKKLPLKGKTTGPPAPPPKLSVDSSGASTAHHKPGDYESFFTSSFAGRDYSSLLKNADPAIVQLAKQIAERERTGGDAQGSPPKSAGRPSSSSSVANGSGGGSGKPGASKR